MNILGSPDAINAAARNLDQRAGDLETCAHRLRARSQELSWSCRKADRFRGEMDAKDSQLRQRAAELHNLATDLRHVARQVQSEINAINSFERRVRQMIRDVERLPLGLGELVKSTILKLGGLPGPGDPRWRDIAKSLGIR